MNSVSHQEYVNSELESKYSDAYRNSVIEVGTVGNWRDADLQIRSNGMHVVTDAIEDAGEFLGALYHDLNKSRPVVRALSNVLSFSPLIYLLIGCLQAAPVLGFVRCY